MSAKDNLAALSRKRSFIHKKNRRSELRRFNGRLAWLAKMYSLFNIPIDDAVLSISLYLSTIPVKYNPCLSRSFLTILATVKV